tara:strand:- start:118 stop:750 length:633 start_codon:yes stop_codon:yes gene_type:complete
MEELQFLKQFRDTTQGRNLLRAIRYAEGTDLYNREGESPYTTLYGGGQFTSFDKHPDQLVIGGKGSPNSTAAGAYQFKPSTWKEAQQALGLKDFSPESQDLAALFEANRRMEGFGGGRDIGGLSYLRYNDFDKDVMDNLAGAWAAIPNFEGKSFYKQPVKSHEQMMEAYLGEDEYNYRNSPEAKAKAEAWKSMSDEEKLKLIGPLPPLPQ